MNDMRKLMEAVAPLFEGPNELNKMLAKFEQTCAEEYRCYGDVNAARVDALLKSGKGTGAAAEEMINSMSTQDGGEAPDIVYDVARDMLDDYMAEHGDMGAAMAQYEDAEVVKENEYSDAASDLEEIADQINQLIEQAMDLIPRDSSSRRRAEAYWYSQIKAAIGGDGSSGSMYSIMDNVRELSEEDDYDDEY